jgi:hypothetical protein
MLSAREVVKGRHRLRGGHAWALCVDRGMDERDPTSLCFVGRFIGIEAAAGHRIVSIAGILVGLPGFEPGPYPIILYCVIASICIFNNFIEGS